MRYTQYTQEDLKAMSLTDLKKVDIYSAEEEQHIQVLMNIQMEKYPAVAPVNPLVFPHAVTDGIKTLEQEHELQRQMDAHNEKTTRNIMGEAEADPVEPEEPAPAVPEEAPVAPVESQIVKPAFCQFCDSKGRFHKRECTREKVIA